MLWCVLFAVRWPMVLGFVIQLFPAFLVPFALRWFLGRFNGAGFTVGIVAGFAASLSVVFGLGGLTLNQAQTLAFVSAVSLEGCLLGTRLSAPVAAETPETFYLRICPLGWWPREWKVDDLGEHRADLIRLPIALVWQVATFLLPMTLVLPKVFESLLLWVMFKTEHRPSIRGESMRRGRG